MPALKPHGFDDNTLPYILLSPYENGSASLTTVKEAQETLKSVIQELKGATKNTGSLGPTIQKINKKYYGDIANDDNGVYIPITETFQIVSENEFEAIDPMSSFSGAFGGAANMVGANIMGVNNIMGKYWAGTNIGIGSLTFAVAVDASMPAETIKDAVKNNKQYIDRLTKLFFTSRPASDVGVLTPPAFCKLTSSFGFNRKYVGIKNLKVDTVGMWNTEKNPIAYNITIEVEDLVLALTNDKTDNPLGGGV